MDIDGFINNFSFQFEDTDPSVFKFDTVFKDLDEWSSIVALSVIAMIDEEYSVTVNGDDMINSNTINDLFKLIIEKK